MSALRRLPRIGVDVRNDRRLVPAADRIAGPDPFGGAVNAAFAGSDQILLLGSVAQVLEAGIGERQPLHAVDPRNADAAEIRERLDRIAAGVEPARQDIGVLKSRAGALP